jgi:STE24 endopeptidase
MSLPESNSQPDTPEAREYNRTKRWLEMGDLAIGMGFLVALLVFGWTNILRDFAKRMAGDHYALQLFYYVVLLSVISKLLGLALDVYGFRLEHRFNLSNQKLGSWIGDQIKGWLLGIVLGTIIAEIVYSMIALSREYWWLFAWLIFVPLLIFFVQIYPVIISPLFEKFSPIQNEELKARLLRLGERAGTRIRGVYEWKFSQKSKKANAYIAGLGSTRRIVLADTLLANYSDDEIEAVMAHELGHQVHRHMVKMIVVELGVTLLAFWLASRVLDYAIDDLRMFTHATDFASIPLLALVSSVLSLLLLPALNAYSRFNERQADVYCWKSVNTVDPYITAMEKLNKQNLAESNPSRIVEILFHSHPPISKRIAAAQEWARKHRPSLAT